MMIEESAARRGARGCRSGGGSAGGSTVAVLLLTAVGILASGLLQYRAQERFLRESLGGLLLNIARTGALLVDGDAPRAGGAGGPERHARVPGPAGPSAADPGDQPARRRGLHAVEHRRRHRPLRRDQQRGGSGGPGRIALAPGDPAGAPARARGGAGRLHRHLHERATAAGSPPSRRSGTGPSRRWRALEVDFRADVYLAQLQAVRRRLWLHSLVAGPAGGRRGRAHLAAGHAAGGPARRRGPAGGRGGPGQPGPDRRAGRDRAPRQRVPPDGGPPARLPPQPGGRAGARARVPRRRERDRSAAWPAASGGPGRRPRARSGAAGGARAGRAAPRHRRDPDSGVGAAQAGSAQPRGAAPGAGSPAGRGRDPGGRSRC